MYTTYLPKYLKENIKSANISRQSHHTLPSSAHFNQMGKEYFTFSISTRFLFFFFLSELTSIYLAYFQKGRKFVKIINMS